MLKFRQLGSKTDVSIQPGKWLAECMANGTHSIIIYCMDETDEWINEYSEMGILGKRLNLPWLRFLLGQQGNGEDNYWDNKRGAKKLGENDLGRVTMITYAWVGWIQTTYEKNAQHFLEHLKVIQCEDKSCDSLISR